MSGFDSQHMLMGSTALYRAHAAGFYHKLKKSKLQEEN
jgi:hypothetical protein